MVIKIIGAIVTVIVTIGCAYALLKVASDADDETEKYFAKTRKEN